MADSNLFQSALRQAEQAAAHDVPVALCGEPGTGKGLLARHIHDRSARCAGPFLRGRTPADAIGGTLYVEEASVLTLAELHAMRSQTDARIILAVCRPCELADITIMLPPLRERPEDIATLAAQFAQPLGLSNRAQALLSRHTWPGNVRELRHVVESARVNAGNGLLDDADLEALLPTASATLDLRVRVRKFEQKIFREALRRCRGKKSAAARMLGFDPSNWSYHAKRIGLQ